MNVTQIIETGLKANGFDGLIIRGVCDCLIGDISPGNCLRDECEGGYKHTHSKRPYCWLISVDKNPMTDWDIEDRTREVN